MRQYTATCILFCLIPTAGSVPSVSTSCVLVSNKDQYVREGTLVDCDCEDTVTGVEEIIWESAKHGILAQTNASVQNSVHINMQLNDTDDNDVIRCKSRTGETLVTGPEFYIKVAYGPRTVYMAISQNPDALDNCPFCNKTITVTSFPGSSSPDTIITIYKDNISVYDGTNTTTTFTVSSGGSLTVQCLARNSVFPDIFVHSSQILEIPEIPAMAPVMSVDGETLPQVTTRENINIVITCRINGGYPQVDSTTVQCGHLQPFTMAGSVVIFTLPITRDLNQAVCACSGSHVSGAYNRTSSLVLNVQYAVSITSFTINEHAGSQNISNKTPVHVSCQADGNPTPYIVIMPVNGNKLVQATSSLLNFTTSLPCDDAPAYVCQAGNSVGTTATSTINVTTLCVSDPQHLDPVPIIVGVVVPVAAILIAIPVVVFIIRCKKSRSSEREPEVSAPAQLPHRDYTNTGPGGTHQSGNYAKTGPGGTHQSGNYDNIGPGGTHQSGNYANIGPRGTPLSGRYNALVPESQANINPYEKCNTNTTLRNEASDSPEDYNSVHIAATDRVLCTAEERQTDINFEEPSIEIIPIEPDVTHTVNGEGSSSANSINKPPVLPKKVRPKVMSSGPLERDVNHYKVPATSGRWTNCSSAKLVQ